MNEKKVDKENNKERKNESQVLKMKEGGKQEINEARHGRKEE